MIPQGNFRFIADQPGLYSEIYDDPHLTGLVLTRIDGHINANWGTGGPPRVATDTFSVRWGGELIPAHTSGTQVYTFKATANDGVRLWIDDVLLIDQWTAIGENTYTASASLAAGRTYPIRLEYSENTGNARVVLKWSTIGLPEQVIEEPNYRSRHRDYSVDCTSGSA